MPQFTCFIGVGINYLKRAEPPRYRLFIEGGIGVNAVGDRHRRGHPFPSSFREEGWSITETANNLAGMSAIFKAMHDMQDYFDEYVNKGDSEPRQSKVVVRADRGGGSRRAPVKRKT